MKIYKANQAFLMPVILFTITFVVIIFTIIGSFSLTTYNLSVRETYRVNAQLTADAGLDASLIELNNVADWAGTTGEVEVLNTGAIKTTYQTSILNGPSENQKVVSVTARTYSPADSVTPKLTRKYEVDVQAVTSGTSITSVVSGVGGLVLSNNSKITGGDVVVNGKITMSNQSQIGTQSNHVNVRVAHQNCPQPANSTYPQLCGPGNGQPISLSNNAKIYGDVQANNQTSGNGMSNPGLTASSGVAPISLPTYNRAAHPVATTRNASEAGIACPNNNGSVTWPANVKIVGNINMGNNCTITITGNVWITGNFSTGNQGRIIVANSLGTTKPVIMVDGSSGFTLQNNGRVVPNASGTGIELRTFWSSGGGCSPGCTTLTGTALANSQNVVTIDLGNNGNAPNSVFMAQWSRVRVSNNGALGAVAGQSIELGNQAVINFTASVPGSNNLTQTWVKRGYMRVFD